MRLESREVAEELLGMAKKTKGLCTVNFAIHRPRFFKLSAPQCTLLPPYVPQQPGYSAHISRFVWYSSS